MFLILLIIFLYIKIKKEEYMILFKTIFYIIIIPFNLITNKQIITE